MAYVSGKKYNPDVYMVGEVWDNAETIYSHYADDSVQSFFNFALSTADGGNQIPAIVGASVTDKSGELKNVVEAKENGTAKGIDAFVRKQSRYFTRCKFGCVGIR